MTLHETRLTAANAASLVEGHDVVIDATDNFPARYAINDACLLHGVPFSYLVPDADLLDHAAVVCRSRTTRLVRPWTIEADGEAVQIAVPDRQDPTEQPPAKLLDTPGTPTIATMPSSATALSIS